MTNFNITSDEHISLVENTANEVSKRATEGNPKKNKGKSGKSQPKQSKPKQAKQRKGKNVKSASKSLKKSAFQKPKASSAAGGTSGKRDICLYCQEADDITKWVQCQSCELWAHYECAGVDDSVFTWQCEFCD